MAELSVAILGLGRVGASLGLALQRYNNTPNAMNRFSVTGYDPLASQQSAAEKLGAVSETVGSPVSAAEDKDLVIIAASYAQTRSIYKAIGASLREGAVLLDLSPLKQPALQWAKEFLPSGVHLIGGTAVLNPSYLWDGLDSQDYASADLFDHGAFLLAPSPSANQEAVALVTQLCELLNIPAHFVDPAEHDGIIAAVEAVPALVGVAAYRAMQASTGWGELQRATNPAFGRLTHHLLDTHPDDLRDLLLLNRENSARQLGAVIAQLNTLQELLLQNDADALEAALTDAEQSYRGWFKRRTNGKWDTLQDDEKPRGASMLSSMLGGFLADKFGGKKNN